MRLKALAFAILCAIECPAQSHMNWQNYCFEHPKAAFCPNREFSGKRTQPNEPEPTSPAVIRSNARVNTPGAARAPVTATNANVIATVRSDINFQFADPAADALAGIHVRRIVDAEITRALISALLSRRGLNQEAVQDLLNRSSKIGRAHV